MAYAIIGPSLSLPLRPPTVAITRIPDKARQWHVPATPPLASRRGHDGIALRLPSPACATAASYGRRVENTCCKPMF
jgi:hypothetical protein